MAEFPEKGLQYTHAQRESRKSLITVTCTCTRAHTDRIEKDEINVPIALSAFRDGDQGPSKVTKTELSQKGWQFDREGPTEP